MSVFPAKNEREIFHRFKQFSVICHLLLLYVYVQTGGTETCDTRHHMDCDWQISVLNVSFNFIATLLCLSLKSPRAAAVIMLFSPLFPSL
jgi:hypothetical protein